MVRATNEGENRQGAKQMSIARCLLQKIAQLKLGQLAHSACWLNVWLRALVGQ